MASCLFSFLFMDLKSEDIRLDPDLYDACRQDRIKLCQNVAFGNAQVSSRTQAAVNCLCFCR